VLGNVLPGPGTIYLSISMGLRTMATNWSSVCA
jgi:hypothetical protein